ncbi:MAG: hypothetical protein KAJ81_11530 [Candidatus Latescibacteria bacterium]|nr:hypothetical protein [Candidatus Latescibacterota bacterium]
MRCRILSMRAGINGLTSEDVIYLEISLMLESVFSIIELLVLLNNDLSFEFFSYARFNPEAY